MRIKLKPVLFYQMIRKQKKLFRQPDFNMKRYRQDHLSNYLRKSFSLSRSQRSISHLIVIQLSFRDLPGTRRFSRYFLICAPPFFHLFNYQQVFRGVKTPSRRSNRWPAYGSLSYIYGGPAPVSN